MLEQLPDEVLVNIITRLEPHGDFDKALKALPCVCRAWEAALASDKTRFWILLSQATKSHGTTTATTTTTRTTTRRQGNVKRAFFQRQEEIEQARIRQDDALVEGAAQRLRKSDCVAWIRRRVVQQQQDSTRHFTVLCHAARCLEHRTMLHYACWYGRIKTIQWLLYTTELLVKDEPQNEKRQQKGDYSSSSSSLIHVVDDNGATPLLLAAWAGQAAAVRLVLANYHCNERGGDDPNLLHQKGLPPLTSSCGGKGPKTALEWARRKGFRNVVQLLKRAGATH